jgi:transcriptional regulator with XRE-family HTH domain
MSTEAHTDDAERPGFPELTELGKRLELLRIERGFSKQHLARVAGTSRQQLWRVMTGKSDLGDGLRQRLAAVLQVDGTTLTGDMAGLPRTVSASSLGAIGSPPISEQPPSLDVYLADESMLERTLRSLPDGDCGRAVKRALLNALEDEAMACGLSLPAAFFDVRRRVISQEL